jgi:predicted RNase H-like nuclease (RuvC/YqgF family)
MTIKMSVEDAVRKAISDPEGRKAFRSRWPMYDVAQLKAEIVKCDKDVEAFEEAIIKALQNKRELEHLIKQCEKRDEALNHMLDNPGVNGHARHSGL